MVESPKRKNVVAALVAGKMMVGYFWQCIVAIGIRTELHRMQNSRDGGATTSY